MKQPKEGQALLIVLLVAALALVFGLSIVAQSTTDIRISQHENEASRAFNAAEAGIEQALKSVSLGTGSLTVDNIDVKYQVTGQNFLESSFQPNESAQVSLGSQVNQITVNWADITSGSCPNAASLEISVFRSNGTVRKFGLNACSAVSQNNFTHITTAGESGYLRQYSFNVTAGDRLVRLRPVYYQTKIKVTAANALPIQTYLVNSQASSLTLESKAIEVSRSEPAAPAIFDYVLFSGAGLTKP